MDDISGKKKTRDRHLALYCVAFKNSQLSLTEIGMDQPKPNQYYMYIYIYHANSSFLPSHIKNSSSVCSRQCTTCRHFDC